MFPVMATVLPHMDPFFFTLIRYGLAAVVFGFLLIFKEGYKSFLQLEKKGYLILLGSMGFGGYGFLVFFGQQLAGPHGQITTAVFMALMPMLSVFINWVLKGLRPKPLTLVFVTLSFLGVLTAATDGKFTVLTNLGTTFEANILIILGAFCWVSYTNGATLFPNWTPLKYTTITTFFGLPVIILVNLVLHLSNIFSVPSLSTILSLSPQISYMVIIAAVVAVLAWNTGNKLLKPINGVLFMDLVPVTAFFVAMSRGLIPTSAEIFGATLTITALVLNNVYIRSLARAN